MNEQILVPFFPYHFNAILPYRVVYYTQVMKSFPEYKNISIQQTENKESVKKEEFIECQKTEKCNLKIEVTEMSNYCHMFPGQTKNYYKNIGQKIKKFIYTQFSEFSQIMSDLAIRKFLKIESQKYNRNSIQKLMKSQKGRKICRLFFAQFKWVKPFLTQNKTDLDLYFRYNRTLCIKKEKKQKKIKSKEFMMKEEI
ncbi:unnamed protein product [Paramecium sonneborni]|uniref:Uncharacterized protein n=1 Tax=Paramecium sonneborni TaxID=65129 RepID=A0A8S1M1A1_9CILI|nr:unnamed protein product [Paramecium sonneborni]CAD8071575.1 unnamed protein product [Paramecium sonneborni]